MKAKETRHRARPQAGHAGVLGLGLCLLALAAAAATNTVSDPVGFVRFEIAPANEVLVAFPFEALDPDINGLLKGQLTGATNETAADAIREWDPVLQSYSDAYKADFTGDPSKDGVWFSDFATWTTSTLSFTPGEGLWIRNSQNNTQQVFFCGALVLDDTAVVQLDPGYNLFGYPFASSLALNSTTLRNSGAYGTSPVTDADGIYDAASLSAWLLGDPGAPYDGLWVDAATNASTMELGLGHGYWYYRTLTNGFTWVEPRPYSGAFAGNTNPHVITAMTVSSNGAALTLTIQTTGVPGELLEVYTKDLAATGMLDNALWNLAETGIAVNGTASVDWTDAGSAGRPPVNSVYARFYLVGRGDIDSDGDGLPDSRERFVTGTNPYLADTDGNGVPDGLEPGLGNNPLFTNACYFLPFVENFETNTVVVGDLNGQNGWIASPAGAALVQTGTVCSGSQALQVYDIATGVTVRHAFMMPGSQVVWADLHVQAIPCLALPEELTGSAAFVFDGGGRLVVYDGSQAAGAKWVTLTNAPTVPTGTWVRLTLKLDYAAQQWTLLLDATNNVAAGLGFASPCTGFSPWGSTACRPCSTMSASAPTSSRTSTRTKTDCRTHGRSLTSAPALPAIPTPRQARTLTMTVFPTCRNTCSAPTRRTRTPMATG